MKCPSCGSERVFLSRAKSRSDKFLTRTLPVKFYRCHDCNHRRSRLKRGWKHVGAYGLSLIGYAATLAVVLAVAGGLIALTLRFLGVPMPFAR